MLCAPLSNLVVDYVSFRLRSRQANALGIRAYVNSLHTPRTVGVVEKLLEHIHAHCLSKHGLIEGCRNIDVAKFMAAFLFADRTDDVATKTVRDTARPLLCTFSAIMARLRWLGSSATLDGVDASLTAPFLSKLTAYHNAHDRYEGVNRDRLVERIEHALVGLYQLRSTYADGGEVPIWLAECDTQVNLLRQRLVLMVGMDALERFHARLTGGLRVPAI
jgi:hypothetical protein